MDFAFFLNSILLGIGLAMDAFSVSMANGLKEPHMKSGRMNYIAGMYGFFQFLMPMVGWICVHSIVTYFSKFQKFIPYIALGLLLYIGGEMILEAFKKEKKEAEDKQLTFAVILVQAIATSIDALSVGFTISDYNLLMAFIASVIIALVTHIICLVGLSIGKKFGVKLADKASVFGGIILIGIGIEIFVRGVFF